jgi:hypothetical protein
MEIELEVAKTYYLAPIKSESKFLVGGMDHVNHLASLMVKGDIVATAGVEGEDCILIVNWDDERCELMLNQMRALMIERVNRMSHIVKDEFNERQNTQND